MPSKHLFEKNMMTILSYWIFERESVRRNKEAAKPKPWTKDPLLQGYRWCNVRRMDDKVSRWLMDMWYHQPFAKSKQGAITLVGLGRLLNWPDSLYRLLPMREWHMGEALAKLQAYRDEGNKVFTGAYIVNGSGGGDKLVT